MVAKMQPARDERDLRQIVLSQIRQKPETTEAEVTIAADHGIVTLTGSVKTNVERIAVETVAKQVSGVKAVANDLVVKPPRERSSTEIATDVLRELRSHIFLAAEDIRVIVRDGCVTLEGNVHQELQKMLAEAQAKRLRGIFGISNQLEVKPEAPAQVSVETNGLDVAGSSNDLAWVETGEAEAG
jgi:osmotically-inducible protein OsmY